MAWFDSVKDKKDKEREARLPARLKDKSPEQIDKELEDAEKTRIELNLARDQIRDQNERMTQFETEFNSVKESLRTAEANRRPPEPPQQITAETWVEDPNKAFDGKVAPLTAFAVSNAATTARILAQQMLENMDTTRGSMDGRLFRAWTDELTRESAKYNAAQLVKPDAWIGIFYYLKGVHGDELRDPEVRKKKYSFLEPASTTAPPPPQEKKEDTLTDQEKHIADRMGVSHENYLKRKKSMTFANA